MRGRARGRGEKPGCTEVRALGLRGGKAAAHDLARLRVLLEHQQQHAQVPARPRAAPRASGSAAAHGNGSKGVKWL